MSEPYGDAWLAAALEAACHDPELDAALAATAAEDAAALEILDRLAGAEAVDWRDLDVAAEAATGEDAAELLAALDDLADLDEITPDSWD